MIIVCLWQHKHIWVLLKFEAQAAPRVLSTSSTDTAFCVTRRYFFHFYILNCLLGCHPKTLANTHDGNNVLCCCVVFGFCWVFLTIGCHSFRMGFLHDPS